MLSKSWLYRLILPILGPYKIETIHLSLFVSLHLLKMLLRFLLLYMSFFIAKCHSTVQIYHFLKSTFLLIDIGFFSSLGQFWRWLLSTALYILFSKYTGVRLLGHKLDVYSVLLKIAKQFSKYLHQIYTPTSKYRADHIHLHHQNYFELSIFSILAILNGIMILLSIWLDFHLV